MIYCDIMRTWGAAELGKARRRGFGVQVIHWGFSYNPQASFNYEGIETRSNYSSKISYKQISYIIPIDEKPYIVHLRQRHFLADNFMVYLYNQGSVNSQSSNIKTQCYYQGSVEGYPNSIVTLSTCLGLRGILQFENVSYGIEPLETEVEFQHILYKLRNENIKFAVHTENNRDIGQNPMDYNIFVSEKVETAVSDLIPLYLEMHIVVDKVLYDFLGSDSMIVTNKVIGIIGLVNSAFAQLKVTIVLSSLELWSDKNKISTVGEEDELLHRFLEWKKSYLALRPHDIAYLFMYRDYPDYVGATFPGKMCVTNYSAGIALYSEGVTLEAFSVIVTQMLGLSLGISYDHPKKCPCSGAICIMNPEAVQSSGVKTFSSCSLSDFRHFISNMGAKCLQNKPQMQVAGAICGNGRVEQPEACDCGTEEQCGPASCCDPVNCVLKPGSECDKGLCCHNCKFAKAGAVCRPTAHPDCDLPESCNGTSGDCIPDVTVLNGRPCKTKYICYGGDCQDLDARCQSIFGSGSLNAPFACYEEIQSQIDRFGNCGMERGQYRFCQWRNLICGRLICTYPTRTPFYRDNVAVLYAYVRNVICITLDYSLHGLLTDPMMVKDGSQCDEGRICVNRECVESRMLKSDFLKCSAKCSGHGVCNSQQHCLCDKGWSGATCNQRSREADSLTAEEIKEIEDKFSSEEVYNLNEKNLLVAVNEILEGREHSLLMKRAFWKSEKNRWLLGFYIALPVLVIATVIAISWNQLRKWFTKEEESLSSGSESSTHTYTTTSWSFIFRDPDRKAVAKQILSVWEAKSPKQSYQQDWFLLEALRKNLFRASLLASCGCQQAVVFLAGRCRLRPMQCFPRGRLSYASQSVSL
ncbi:disintegrin and metalloproteinase domain-containing protein 32 [Sturnira hondurensis]|uniref:disintegrin and metalloproteinase domain-containing protein 32 n=1 Tax=Sturnira hondurensis TaxID=192404 RepID=UPI0018793B28|nr:disintegrin and metalloproteinase domain-containing protein 32 [Sturnira hondurensis]